MDPITHGLLGASMARSAGEKADWKIALTGAAGGMIPDLDVFIHSARDPLLFFEFHRHFSHSLFFIPVGGFLCSVIFWFLFRKKVPLKILALAATLGYASHPFLDACTSYGTLLYWPFGERRVAWDVISILDPLFTLFLVLGLALTAYLRRRTPVVLGLLGCLLYLGFGAYQHQRGLQFQQNLAHTRGHDVQEARRRVMPTLGNLLVWRSIYQMNGRIYVDALRIPPEKEARLWEGGTLPSFHEESVSPPAGSVLEKDLKRYAAFTDGFLTRLEGPAYRVGDARYSGMPHGILPLWGIRFDPKNANSHVNRLRFRPSIKRDLPYFWEMVSGKATATRPL